MFGILTPYLNKKLLAGLGPIFSLQVNVRDI